MQPAAILKRYWSYDSFRPQQEEIINSILRDRDTVALLPTGAGKSICYQVPALARDGFTLVISPLIALMQDQVTRLKELDIMASCIHAGMNYHEVKTTLENMLHGPYKLLYVSPERLQTELFKDYLPSFDINLLAVDEAHCISQWGHDFRPDYLKIAGLRPLFPDVPILALTASATPKVLEDIELQLQLHDAAIFRQSIERNNIFYSVQYSENKNKDLEEQLPTGACSIVYCRSRKQTEVLARKLIDRRIRAACYHAGMPKDERAKAQTSWMSGETNTIIATTAFGMGIDKPDVRMVLHYDAPEHLEAYYQEAGRAGRDTLPSTALMFYNAADVNRLRESTALKFPGEPYLRQIYQAVTEYLQVPIGAQPDKYFSFDLPDFCKKFGFELPPASHALKLLAQEGLWTISEAVFHPASIQFITGRQQLDQVTTTYPDLGYVITGLLRLYGTIFHFPTTVRIAAVAAQLKIKKDLLEQILQKLHQMEVLEYSKPAEGPQLYFHHYRVDSRHLIIDMQRINNLRRQHEARTAAMIAYLQNDKICRERMLKKYFAEQADTDCGHCDICRIKATNTSPRNVAQLILEYLETSGNIPLAQLVKHFPDTGETLTVLRKLTDEGFVTIDGNNIVSLAY
jgi:ATP-dependent DNA helicase RecQ